MKKLTALTIILFLSVLVFAQSKSYNPNEKLKFDPDYRVGTLDNGLKYYIKHNKKPAERAEFWLLVHAGSMQEDANQNGLAHFCEHMAFNGTKNFPDKAVLDYLQSIGMEFGPNINAWTFYNETVFTLTAVPLKNEAYIDSSLLVLKDWASAVSYLDEEVEKERGVIREEWRYRNSSYSRINDIENTFIYKDSKYAKHNVIGELDIIDNANPQRLRDFFNTWYRPDLQAIAAIGDFDVDEIEQKIIALYSDLEMPKNPTPRIKQEIPDHKETLITINKDKEATRIQTKLYIKQDALTPNKTIDDYRNTLTRQLAFSMLKRRIDERNRAEGNPMSYGSVYFNNLMPEKSALTVYNYPKEESVLQAFEMELEELFRAVQTGFTESELKEIKTSNLRSAENYAKEAKTRESRRQGYAVRSAFFNEQTILHPEQYLEYKRLLSPTITLEEVNTVLIKLIKKENRVITLSGPENVKLPDEKALLEVLTKAENKQYEPYIPMKLIDDLISETPKTGKITNEKEKNPLGYETWTLENGIKLHVKHSENEANRFKFLLKSRGGSSYYDANQRALIEMTPSVIFNSGLGEFTSLQVKRYMSGKYFYKYGNIGEYIEMIQGAGSIADIDDAFKNIHLLFAAPRIDSVGFNKTLSGEEIWYKNKSNEPRQVMYDSLNCIRYNYHERAIPLTFDDYKSVSYDDILQCYKERFGNPADFEFYFIGNFDLDSLKPLIETYLGSLKTSNIKEDYKDVGKRYHQNAITKTIQLPMVMPRAKVHIEFKGLKTYNLRNTALIEAVSAILDRRYTETIREDEGGTYGVSTYGYFRDFPQETYKYVISFECAPERVDELKAIALDEIEKLKSGDVDLKYLNDHKTAFEKKSDEDNENDFFVMFDMEQNEEHNWYYNSLEMKETVNNLKMDEVVDFANKIFKAESKLDVVFLPSNGEK
ncbi:MAG: insulinase family protein [Bacteroidota bacterium]|nr:insulinase family protein [Bacteroidota bacterium]